MGTSVLKPNPEVYAIRGVSHPTVAKYRDAMKAGGVFPPVLASSDGYIYDGLSIYRAAESLKLLQFVEYHDALRDELPEAEWVRLHVEANAKHGRPLSYIESKRAAVVMRKGGLTPLEIATAFALTGKQAKLFLKGKIVVVKGTGARKVPDSGIQRLLGSSGRLPGKPNVPEGAKVTADEYAVMDRKDSGVPFARQLDQPTRWLANPTLTPWTDVNQKALRRFLQVVLDRPEAKAELDDMLS